MANGGKWGKTGEAFFLIPVYNCDMKNNDSGIGMNEAYVRVISGSPKVNAFTPGALATEALTRAFAAEAITTKALPFAFY